MAEKKKSQGIILAISCTNKAHASKQDDFCMYNGCANFIAKVGGYTCRCVVLFFLNLSWIMRLQHGGCNFPG